MTASDPAPTLRDAGRPHHARVVAGVTFLPLLGWIGAAHQVGAASIALAAGTVRGPLGDYRPGVPRLRRAARGGGDARPPRARHPGARPAAGGGTRDRARRLTTA